MKLTLLLVGALGLHLCVGLDVLVEKAMSFDNAVAQCKSMEMTLAIARTHSRMVELVSTMRAQGIFEVWIGVRADETGHWGYVGMDGLSIGNYFWRIYEPNNLTLNENCVEIALFRDSPLLQIDPEMKYWNDLNCELELPFFCQDQ